MTKTVRVDDMGYGSHSGHKIAISIDGNGHVEFAPTDDTDAQWVHPRALVAALKELGVLREDVAVSPDYAEKTPPREWPSDRVRESWRQAARDDANERPDIEHHAYRRRLEAQRKREQAAKLAGPRFFRDSQGDIWRSHPDGRLSLYRMRSGIRVDIADPRARAFVEQHYAPLTEVPDPYGVTRSTQRPPLDRAVAANYWAQASGATSRRWVADETRTFAENKDDLRRVAANYMDQAGRTSLRSWAERMVENHQTRDQETAAIVARLREEAQRDINDSVWRRF